MTKAIQYIITATLVISAIAITVMIFQRGYVREAVHLIFHDHSDPSAHSDVEAREQSAAKPDSEPAR